GTRQVMTAAPLLLDRLNAEDREHFETVKRLLDGAGLAYEVDPTLVRGLDYYTRTVFEFTSDALGSHSRVGGGGGADAAPRAAHADGSAAARPLRRLRQARVPRGRVSARGRGPSRGPL